MKLTHLVSVFLCIGFTAAGIMAKSPYTKPNNSWISLEGTIVATTDNTFDLDYGQGIVTVEMDDWDWYEEGKALIVGDDVTVYGRVDDDLYETTSIEAQTVYVDDLNTFFYASAADEEDADIYIAPIYSDYDLQLTGKVTSVSGREFTIDVGKRKVTVDTDNMPYNPLDDAGYQQIEKNDWVTVSGDIEYDLFNNRELEAESIVTLLDNSKSKKNK
ncbi:MAG: hypothetical protein GF401_02840 [Chitinivibrionales bacterium]|nr:hypothetical protein [Chitinivibrionales bacterium]